MVTMMYILILVGFVAGIVTTIIVLATTGFSKTDTSFYGPVNTTPLSKLIEDADDGDVIEYDGIRYLVVTKIEDRDV